VLLVRHGSTLSATTLFWDGLTITCYELQEVKGMLIMLRAYFDDAGTHRSAPVVVLGGLIGTVGQWEQLERAWGERLANPLPEAAKNPLSMFHLGPCLRADADSEFRDYKPVERELVARNFRDIVHGSQLASTASAVDLEAWDELVTGPVREFLGSGLETCFVNCLDRARDYAFDHPEGDRIAVMFDQGIENGRLREIVDMHSDAEHAFCSITFGAVRSHYPLQAADIIATESYWYADRWLWSEGSAEPRPPFRQFYEQMPAEGLILDRHGILEELKRRGPDGRLLPMKRSTPRI
jgi:hypothetical protein